MWASWQSSSMFKINSSFPSIVSVLFFNYHNDRARWRFLISQERRNSKERKNLYAFIFSCPTRCDLIQNKETILFQGLRHYRKESKKYFLLFIIILIFFLNLISFLFINLNVILKESEQKKARIWNLKKVKYFIKTET